MANFANPESVIEGWYWAIRSSDLRAGRSRPVRMLGRDLVFYRAKGGMAVALDAFCPHMGAHLAEGRVEGDSIRCRFHGWKFAPGGECTDLPYVGGKPPFRVSARSWRVAEAYGLVWLWAGVGEPPPLPMPPELAATPFATRLGGAFAKNCHPHVVLVNAIDEHHFNGVHALPVKLWMRASVLSERAIAFANQTRLGDETWLRRLLGRFYAGPLTYALTYWFGSTGLVTLGPDFEHVHILFALRPAAAGGSEGQTVLFVRKRPGAVGWLWNRLLLRATGWIGRYFAHGDTRIFRSIRFSLDTPIEADHAIVEFIAHVDRQPVAAFDSRHTTMEAPHA